MTALFEPPASAATGAGDWLRSARDRLEAVGIESASLDARMLLLDGLGLPHSVIVAEPNLALTPEELERLEAMLGRRLAREPVSRILGWREFYGRRFKLTPDVLDPRPDTEVLVEAALEEIDQRFGPDHACRLLDIGAGSGAIAVSLLAERPAWRGVATDVSGAALQVAGENAAAHKVADRLEMVETNWAAGVSGPFDLVVSNPPYIASPEIATLMAEVREHDPAPALDGGADGLDAYREIFACAGALLGDGGVLLVEIGAAQAGQVAALAVEAGLVSSADEVRNVADLAGHPRVLIVPAVAGNA